MIDEPATRGNSARPDPLAGFDRPAPPSFLLPLLPWRYLARASFRFATFVIPPHRPSPLLPLSLCLTLARPRGATLSPSALNKSARWLIVTGPRCKYAPSPSLSLPLPPGFRFIIYAGGNV